MSEKFRCCNFDKNPNSTDDRYKYEKIRFW